MILRLLNKKYKFTNERQIPRLMGTFFVTLFFLSKVLFLESGLFACSIYAESSICKCNHSSMNEKHTTRIAKDEEALFAIAITHLGEDALTELSNCHSTKKNEVHKCSCSKKKNTSNIIHSQLINPNFLGIQPIQFLPYIESSYLVSTDRDDLLNGLSPIPDKPPRL
jgi:hypothetical protein